jgi:UDP-hydrolysing UDP-N-acetyl-D-glucosamine 2-epimerase
MNDSSKRRITFVTGSRADFGLLVPVIEACRERSEFITLVIAAGAHLLTPAETWREVDQRFGLDTTVNMQQPGTTGRLADAEALGKGTAGFARAFARLRPDWVIVLGDRIEAFAAASASSVGGIALAHIHGGDRAEGIADEAMRHAITKLAHLHFPATIRSAQRIEQMGEPSARIHPVGSPAADGLAAIAPLEDAPFAALGSPEIVVLHHPAGLDAETEAATVRAVAESVGDRPHLWLDPNADPGSDAVLGAIAALPSSASRTRRDHLPRAEFVALLKRLARSGGLLLGNSSAGLIEAAILGLPAINLGPRQAGRERPATVIDVPEAEPAAIAAAITRAASIDRSTAGHPYGDGKTGPRIATLLSTNDPHDPALLRKHNTY